MAGTAAIWAVIFSLGGALLSLVRSDYSSAGAVAIANLVFDFVLLFFIDWATIYWGMPATANFSTGWAFYLLNLVIVAVVASIADAVASEDQGDQVGAATVVGWASIVVLLIVFTVGHNLDHDPKKAATIVLVTKEPKSAPPASTTSNMVIVSEDIATTTARKAMASGQAGTRQYSTFLELGSPALQYVAGHLWYVFPLHFEGSGNKQRLHAVEPGYIMVSAEDPGANPVEHYDGQYSMIVCKDCGQMNEPDRWAYVHGYHNVLDDPTLEIDDQGNPYWTMTIDTPHVGWTFRAPSKLLVINAHTGAIATYDLNKAPDWVDRVYSKEMAKNIANWYGTYGLNGSAGWNGWFSANNGRFKVSGDPIMVYTGDGHPDWRMLLTSYNSDTAVSSILIMDAHSGSIKEYTPQQAMGIEGPVDNSFNSPTGQGASVVKPSGLHATELTLHVIYGHLTWMAIYENGGDHPSFAGIGFTDAYKAQSNNVAFGSTKEQALQNYQTQLAIDNAGNGNNPSAGSKQDTVSGTIAQVSWDLQGGQKLWYVMLTNDPTHVYAATTAQVKTPALLFAKPGDPVVIGYAGFGNAESQRTMESFTDANVPLKPAGS
jgi:hypothetical protein